MGGKHNKANSPCSIVGGYYNVGKADTLLEIGAGTSDKGKNIFEVLKDGRAKVQSAPVDDDDVVRLKELSILTQEQVDSLF